MSQMKPHDYCYIYPDSLNTKRELYHWGSFAWNTTTCVRTSLTAATVVWTASCWSSCWEAMETSSHSATRLSEWSLKWASHTLTRAAASHYYDHNECSMTLAMGFICSHILHHNIITVPLHVAWWVPSCAWSVHRRRRAEQCRPPRARGPAWCQQQATELLCRCSLLLVGSYITKSNQPNIFPSFVLHFCFIYELLMLS